MSIDFSKYKYLELQESLSKIDKEKYPENYKNLMAAIESYDETKKLEEIDEHETNMTAIAQSIGAILMVLYILVKLHQAGDLIWN